MSGTVAASSERRLSPWITALIATAAGVLASELAVGYLGSWLVDDAGISMAYAHSLQSGLGLVSQAGAVPVEGFSNPLWVFLLALLQGGGTAISLKLLAGGFFVASLVRLATGLRGTGIPVEVALFTSVWLAAQPSVVIWVFSGLENPLFLLLTVEVLIRSARLAAGEGSHGDAAFAAIACGLAALTRPDGAALNAVSLIGVALGGRSAADRLKLSAIVIFVPIIALMGWAIFRINYFGEWLPAPYYAKGGPTLSRFLGIVQLNSHAIDQITSFFSSAFGNFFAGPGTVLSGLLLWTALLRGGDRTLLTLIGAAACLLLTALMLPSDWMGENRYFTAAYPAVLLAMAYSARKVLPEGMFSKVAVVVLVLSAFNSWERVSSFSKQPTISVEEVAARGVTFERWGQALNLDRPSVLIADIGGILLRDQVVVIDLGMLCDLRIAKYLGEGSHETDVTAFRDYIFVEKKPDFISTRAYHAWIAKFDEDPRFRAMYVPIQGYEDQWVQKRYGKAMTAGDFVRADLVADKPEVLEEIRSEAAGQFYPFCLTCKQPGSEQ